MRGGFSLFGREINVPNPFAGLFGKTEKKAQVSAGSGASDPAPPQWNDITESESDTTVQDPTPPATPSPDDATTPEIPEQGNETPPADDAAPTSGGRRRRRKRRKSRRKSKKRGGGCGCASPLVGGRRKKRRRTRKKKKTKRRRRR